VDLTPKTMCVYLDHAFTGMRRVLDRLDDTSVNQRPHGPETNSVAALVVHCCELTPFWLDHVGMGHPTERDRASEFTTEATVAELRDRIDRTESRCHELVGPISSGSTATYHELRAHLPGGDRSDPAVYLHVLEELYQHLGHMELTADAVTSPG
jgi:uncharacterized damage-inducible protein DinB